MASRPTEQAASSSRDTTAEPRHFPIAAGTSAFRDLLIFEERLKQNAARLQSRKKKYEVLLCSFILWMFYRVVLDPSEMLLLLYLQIGLLWVSCVTLFLFFASGVYADRITAANKFVPQANRSLRTLNMYLNTRTVPRTSSWTPWRRQRTIAETESSAADLARAAPQSAGVAAAPEARLHRRTAIPSIPPTSNPRGEIIFSTRVDAHFRHSYEKYRAAFERKRAKKLEAQAWQKRSRFWRWWPWSHPAGGIPPKEKQEPNTYSDSDVPIPEGQAAALEKHGAGPS